MTGMTISANIPNAPIATTASVGVPSSRENRTRVAEATGPAIAMTRLRP